MKMIEKYAPEKPESRSYGPQEVVIEFVDLDGHGRSADGSQWKPWQWETHNQAVEECINNPKVNEAGKASSIDVNEDQAENSSTK